MSIIREIRTGVLDGSKSLAGVLRKARVLAASLRNDELKQWALSELDGYSDQQTLPEYRHLASLPQGTFLGPFGRSISNYLLPVSLMPEFLRNTAKSLAFGNPVREIESMVETATKNDLRHPWPADVVVLLRDGIQLSGGFVLVEAYQIVTRAQLDSLLDSVRSRLLEFLLALEELRPEIIRSDEELKALPSNRVSQAFNVTILGDHNVIATDRAAVHSSRIDVKGADMDIQIANLAVTSLSALANMVQVWQAYRARDETPTARIIADAREQPLLSRQTAALLAQVISDPTLEVIHDSIRKAEDRLNRALQDPSNSNQAKDQEVEIAAATICAELSRIKRLNGGSLPADELRRLWESHRCG